MSEWEWDEHSKRYVKETPDDWVLMAWEEGEWAIVAPDGRDRSGVMPDLESAKRMADLEHSAIVEQGWGEVEDEEEGPVGIDDPGPCQGTIVKSIGVGNELGEEGPYDFSSTAEAMDWAKSQAEALEAEGYKIFWNSNGDYKQVTDLEYLESWVWEARKRVREEMTPSFVREDGSVGAYSDTRDDWQMLHLHSPESDEHTVNFTDMTEEQQKELDAWDEMFKKSLRKAFEAADQWIAWEPYTPDPAILNDLEMSDEWGEPGQFNQVVSMQLGKPIPDIEPCVFLLIQWLRFPWFYYVQLESEEEIEPYLRGDGSVEVLHWSAREIQTEWEAKNECAEQVEDEAAEMDNA